MEDFEEHREKIPSDCESTPLLEKKPGYSSSLRSASASSSAPTSTRESKAASILGASNSELGSNTVSNTRETHFKPDPGMTPASSSSASLQLSSTMSVTPASATMRMPHLHKLEKKHSSGDLHSRLKTRKLLGVGETDDGDIHRSKLSQILGHSDQLYVRLPYGLRIWQLLMAIIFTATGLWAVILPSQLFSSAEQVGEESFVSLPGRLYGAAIISLSLVYWMTLSTQDRDVIRMCLLTSLVYFVIQFLVTSAHLLLSPEPVTRNALILMTFRGLCMLTSFFYHWALSQRKLSTTIKRSSSNKELNKEK